MPSKNILYKAASKLHTQRKYHRKGPYLPFYGIFFGAISRLKYTTVIIYIFIFSNQQIYVMKKGLLYAIMASVLWAIVNPFIKQGLSYDFTPMNFAGLRFTIVGIILFIYSWHKSMWKEIL